MADIKEETTVNNTEQRPEEKTERKTGTSTGYEGLQIFYEKNKNLVNYVGGGLLVLIAGLIYFKFFYLPEQETAAANEMYYAQKYFEADSFKLALTGGKMVISPDGQKAMMGFEQVADEFGLTRSGNLAHYYAGVCLLHTGQFEQAIEHLEKYDGNDETILPISIGAIGDCHLELNHIEDAIKFYLKAASKRNNNFTSPFYLRKAGFAQELNKDFEGAVNSYERIRQEYPSSTEAREIVRAIARAKALGNIE